MSESVKSRQVLSTGQVTFLFLIFISMLIIMFAAGVCIGRWSQSTPDKKGASAQSMTRANVSFVQDQISVEDKKEANQQISAQINQPSVSVAPSSAQVNESRNKSSYAVQVATKSSVEDAQGLLTQLKRDGFSKSYVREPQPDSVNQLYSVEMGPYDDKNSADEASAQLKTKGLNHSRTIQVFGLKNGDKSAGSNAQLSPATP